MKILQNLMYFMISQKLLCLYMDNQNLFVVMSMIISLYTNIERRHVRVVRAAWLWCRKLP